MHVYRDVRLIIEFDSGVLLFDLSDNARVATVHASVTHVPFQRVSHPPNYLSPWAHEDLDAVRRVPSPSHRSRVLIVDAHSRILPVRRRANDSRVQGRSPCVGAPGGGIEPPRSAGRPWRSTPCRAQDPTFARYRYPSDPSYRLAPARVSSLLGEGLRTRDDTNVLSHRDNRSRAWLLVQGPRRGLYCQKGGSPAAGS